MSVEEVTEEALKLSDVLQNAIKNMRCSILHCAPLHLNCAHFPCAPLHLNCAHFPCAPSTSPVPPSTSPVPPSISTVPPSISTVPPSISTVLPSTVPRSTSTVPSFKKNSEVVIAVIESPDKTDKFILRQSEFNSLAPHKWLLGETIECYLRAMLNVKGLGKRIYILNHYSAGVIVFGARSAMANHSLRKLNFDNYDGVIGFMNVANNHWKFLFFRMRQNRYKKTDWVDVKWQQASIEHRIQKDGCNCGVFVMKMATDVVEAFPVVPQGIKIPTSLKDLKDRRITMAKTILQCSGL
ncbi:unnamed protein product [Arctogadus glacialis]